MLTIHFTAEDLARTTIAREPDPLWEVLLSLHLLQDSSAELVCGKWRDHARRAVPRSEVARLLELTPVTGYSPDFLTPVTRHRDVEDALETVVSTPRAAVLAQVDYLMTRQRPTPWTRALAADRPGAMAQLTPTSIWKDVACDSSRRSSAGRRRPSCVTAIFHRCWCIPPGPCPVTCTEATSTSGPNLWPLCSAGPGPTRWR